MAPAKSPASKSPSVEIEVDDRVVKVTNPDRVYFPPATGGATKLDLVDYYLAVGDGIVNALFERPCMLHRFPKGLAGDKVHQKRLPAGAPAWVETVQLHFPRWNRTADELCVTELASVIWAVQMSTVEFHPWNSRRADTEKPDEWRIDLDPGPDCDWATVQRVAHIAHEVLDELGAVGFPKTSGGSGMHVYVRIPPDHGFQDVRRAALAFAREVERRAARDVTTAWWRKDRDPHQLFVDYNQNARDHTIAAAYSVRGVPEARVSAPVRWDEVDACEPDDFTIFTDARSASPRSATCTPTSTTTSSTSRRCWSGPTATRRRAPSRRSTRNHRNDESAIRWIRSRLACTHGVRLRGRPVGAGRRRIPSPRCVPLSSGEGFRLLGGCAASTEAGLRAVAGHRSLVRTGPRGRSSPGRGGAPGQVLAAPDGTAFVLLAWLWDCRYATFTTVARRRHRAADADASGAPIPCGRRRWRGSTTPPTART